MRVAGAVRRIAAAIVGGWLAWRLLGPEIPHHYVAPQRRPLRVPGRTVFVGEREFFVREIGVPDGEPLVLLHGWSLDSEMTYYAIVPGLAERYRIVLPDMRNHGKSDWVRGGYDVADLADEMAGVLDAIGMPAATVFGYSLGGMVAQELARRHPRLVRRLVLAATAAHPVPTRRVLARFAFWVGRIVARISIHEGAHVTMAALRTTGAVGREHERWMHDALLRRDGDLFYEAGAAAVRFDSRDWVGRLPVPVTVVIPTRDLLVPSSAQRELAQAIPGAHVVELEGCGHESILTRAEEYVRLIDDAVTRDP